MKRKLSFFVVLVALLLLFVACEFNGNNKSIVGSWYAPYSDSGDLKLVFNSNGTGYQVLSVDGVEEPRSKVDFTFTYVNSTLTITAEGYTSSGECIIDGNKMTVKNLGDEDLVLTRR